MLTMLGIPNCDSVKKARKHLEALGQEYTLRDVRTQPLSESEWQQLLTADKDGKLINTRSPSFRKTGHKAADLDDGIRLEVLLQMPTAMKRPVLLQDDQLLAIGWDQVQTAFPA